MRLSSWMEQWLTQKWYQTPLSIWLFPLLPFSWLFYLLQAGRRFAYKHFFTTYRSTLPIIVVGNITVGGTGKTPFVIHLANWLTTQGFTPGIILRGVGGKTHEPIVVTTESPANIVGDEALLLATHTKAPVIACKNRTLAAKKIEELKQCDIIISDDGLQHYRLQRDIEIALVDAKRQFGNNQLLPAGPLREPLSRLKTVDIIVENGTLNSQLGFSVHYVPLHFVSVTDNSHIQSLAFFAGKKVHAIAGIGHPEQFFNLLETLGLSLITHIHQDHHAYEQADLLFNDDLPIVMTEKDAVKCREYAHENAWYLAVSLECDAHLYGVLQQLIASRRQ